MTPAEGDREGEDDDEEVLVADVEEEISRKATVPGASPKLAT
jgi:hypothetical protein